MVMVVMMVMVAALVLVMLGGTLIYVVHIYISR
jgi:hypothetical protein